MFPSEAAILLSLMSRRTSETATQALVDGLRRASFKEAQRGLPAHSWVLDIVRPNGRKAKKFCSPEGVSCRSMKQAASSL